MYELDPYDKVRMRLYLPDEKLYKAYNNTIEEIKRNINYQPLKLQMPWWQQWPLLVVEVFIMLLVIYIFLLIIQLALFNLVIMGIILVLINKLFKFAKTCRANCKFNYKTKKFKKFISEQNKEVYYPMNIEIQEDREGTWLAFQLRHDEEMFEKVISERRDKLFNEKTQEAMDAINKMKVILEEYKKEKQQSQTNE